MSEWVSVRSMKMMLGMYVNKVKWEKMVKWGVNKMGMWMEMFVREIE